ncbi:PAS domain-containing protein, partial [Pseudomonas aeruginosa]
MPVAQACWDSAVRGKDQLHVQYRVIRPDGSIVHVDSVAVLVTDAYTLERRLVGITLDISDRVAAEERER